MDAMRLKHTDTQTQESRTGRTRCIRPRPEAAGVSNPVSNPELSGVFPPRYCGGEIDAQVILDRDQIRALGDLGGPR